MPPAWRARSRRKASEELPRVKIRMASMKSLKRRSKGFRLRLRRGARPRASGSIGSIGSGRLYLRGFFLDESREEEDAYERGDEGDGEDEPVAGGDRGEEDGSKGSSEHRSHVIHGTMVPEGAPPVPCRATVGDEGVPGGGAEAFAHAVEEPGYQYLPWPRREGQGAASGGGEGISP